LDKDTTGFVLLTNNGDLAHRLLAPKKHVFKEYMVTLRDKVSKEDICRLEEGLCLRDGLQCKPAYFEPLQPACGILKISEGKFHQIKRMFESLDNKVVALHRISIHGLTLDPALREGECRYLNDSEVAELEAVH
jgi:16S rRNA pseudouridine516 synthase